MFLNDKKLFVNDTNSYLTALSVCCVNPKPRTGFNSYTGNSAGVVGSGEVYKDPRDKWTKRWDSLSGFFMFTSQQQYWSDNWGSTDALQASDLKCQHHRTCSILGKMFVYYRNLHSFSIRFYLSEQAGVFIWRSIIETKPEASEAVWYAS